MEGFDDFDFSILPDKFVLKCSHDSGGVVICHSKKDFDIRQARKKIVSSLKKNYFYKGREYPYKKIKPLIISEILLEDANSDEVKDYKIFVFNLIVKIGYVATDRHSINKGGNYRKAYHLYELIFMK